MSLDLIMRYAVIALAAQLAAAWAQAFQEPWPLPGAFSSSAASAFSCRVSRSSGSSGL